ncbi:uncharacterized protein LOC142173510 [Nicotiana tabacum]|uniref:Uncharacterized protein LOC142173510 n=1 Tax=Nicotiana tabacum TaxID=4097 RepID=A0AC58TDB1_TOBAC
MNEVIEEANKNIKRILQKIVYNHRQWHKKLSFALLGYQNTMRTSARAASYMLVYGTEAVILAEVEIPSLRVIEDAKLDDAEWIWVRQEKLMLINEKRMDVVCHTQLYQNRMASAFNKRVKPRQFIPGQLVSWSQTADAEKTHCTEQTEQISQRGTPSKQQTKLQCYEGHGTH